MKQLQNNFTTPEQSKRLLELGVPADSADCYYYEEGNVCSDSTPNVVPFGEVWTDQSKETMFSSYVDIPCWSAGRLIEILSICCSYRHYLPIDYCTVEYIVAIIDNEIKLNRINFLKLED